MTYRGYQMHTTDKTTPTINIIPFTCETWMDAIHEDKVCRVIVNNAEDYIFNTEQCKEWLVKHYPEPEIIQEPIEVIITKPKTKYKPVRKVEG